MNKSILIQLIEAKPLYEINEYEPCTSDEIDICTFIKKLEEAVKEKWFKDALEELGFFHVDSVVEENKYIDNFVYQARTNYGDTFYNKLSDYQMSTYNIVKVFQEVVGPARNSQLEIANKKRQHAIKKEEERKKRLAESAAERKQKALARKVEKAKALLAKVIENE